MSTESENRLESELNAFVKGPVKLLSADAARTLLEHAATCDKCAALLPENPAHGEALLESLHPAPEWTPTETDLVKGVQSEIVHFGDAVLEQLTRQGDYSEFKTALAKPLLRERAEEFWAVGELDPPRLHVALGCSAIKLSVNAWLASCPDSPARGILTHHGLTVGGKMVSNDLFAERIADYGVLPLALAERTWVAGKHVAIDRQLGVPGTHWLPLGPGKIGLALSAKGIAALSGY
jgi:hypothetical protein